MDGSGERPNFICFLVTSLDYGGAEIQVANMARCLKERGWRVRFVSLVQPGDFGDGLAREGFQVDSLAMKRGIPDPRAIIRLASWLRKWRPDVLHCHMVHANLLGRITRLFAAVPVVVCTVHSIVEGGRFVYRAYRTSEPLCDITTSVSAAGLQRHLENGASTPEHICFLPNGVDISAFHTDKRAGRALREEMAVGNAFVWLAIGRLERAKDYPNMLRAFAQVCKESNTILAIVGTGSLEEEISQCAASLGIEGSVRFLGRRTDIPALMNAADGYLMSSAWEGMPIVLLEAAASSLPVVATAVGGNGEVVLDGISGFLCGSGDSAILAETMRRMMRLSKSERDGMGKAGRRHIVDNYAIDTIIDRWESLYRELHKSKISRMKLGRRILGSENRMP